MFRKITDLIELPVGTIFKVKGIDLVILKINQYNMMDGTIVNFIDLENCGHLYYDSNNKREVQIEVLD